MKHMNHIAILLSVLSLSVTANAEVFKCKQVSGKIIYQPTPCPSGATHQGVIKVKEMTPEETEEAKVRLKAWQEEQAANDAAKKEAEKQRQAELEKQESLELQRRSVIAQEQQAIAEQQRQNQGGGGIIMPPYGFNGRYWTNRPYPPDGTWQPHHLPHDRWEPPMSSPPSPKPLHGPPFPNPHKPVTHPH
jgi:hypothetical protein